MLENLEQPIYMVNDSTGYRVSSWDRTGGNTDYLILLPGKSYTLAELTGPACIRHFYITMINPSRLVYRKFVLRIWWDGETEPSVEVPLGDFFCISNCVVRPVNSLMVIINPGSKEMFSHGLNTYFPMPFGKSAKVEIEYQVTGEGDESPVAFWYHINIERMPKLPVDTIGYFHAHFRRENLTKSIDPKRTNQTLWKGVNLTGDDNYVLLEARGKGQLVGIHLQIDNVAGGWYGEGDDMIFIDGETWPPSYPGTGTEEVFGGGACPNVEYSGAYNGFHLISNTNVSGKNAMYRWYVHDPIRFRKSIKMTIEHGHANNFENDYSSVAYWYQIEPHESFPVLPVVKERIPRFPDAFFGAEKKIAEINGWREKLIVKIGGNVTNQLLTTLRANADKAMWTERYQDALDTYSLLVNFLSKMMSRLDSENK